ncbi:MAG TPA: carboxyl transferase domain-containing protein, partial [Ilumatobacteraceae bacterium]
MSTIAPSIDLRSNQFATNAAHHRALAATLRERQQWALSGGPNRDRAIARHGSRGKLLPRERIDLVIDPDSPFLELSTLSAWGQYDGEAPGAGIITGIGLVHGIPFMFIANDATVKGGSLLPMSIKKHVRAQQIAEENSLGCIYLVDSGGAFLPLQDEVFPDK